MRAWMWGMTTIAGFSVLPACAGGEDTSDTTADADTDADSDSDTDADTDADTDTDTDADTDSDTDTDTGPHLIDAFEVPDVGVPGSDSIDHDTSWAIRCPEVSEDITSLELHLIGPGASGDDLIVDLIADSAGPNGAVMGHTVVNVLDFPDTTVEWTSAYFDAPVVTDSSCWIVLSVPSTSTSTYTADVWDTGAVGRLALKDGTDPWAVYWKNYEWPHRVYGH